jgi:hypothetical protein
MKGERSYDFAVLALDYVLVHECMYQNAFNTMPWFTN